MSQRYRKRARVVNYMDLVGKNTLLSLPNENLRVSFVERQQTWDEEHNWHAYRRWMADKGHAMQGYLQSQVRNVGGDFTTRIDRAEGLTAPFAGAHGANGRFFSGPLFPARPSVSDIRPDVQDVQLGGDQDQSYDSFYSANWPSVSNADDPELSLLGTKLLSSLAPNAPHNSVYTSLGELRNDGLPDTPFLSFFKKNDARSLSEKIGGEWLNYQFGLAPTISDINAIIDTVQKAEKLTKQYLRDSGRHVRRRYDMDPVRSVSSGVISAASSTRVPVGTNASMWSSVGPVVYQDETTIQRSFSGCYSYFVDETSLNGAMGWLDKTNYLYGWKPDPSAVYNLTAWSWLLDWFTNTGDVVDNISLYLEDPSLVRYAYIMEHRKVVRTITQDVVSNDGASYTASVVLKTEIKKRRRINPLYWGLKEDALNARQLSILAALGLTKFRDPGLM
jgi:hypothetical protein